MVETEEGLPGQWWGFLGFGRNWWFLREREADRNLRRISPCLLQPTRGRVPNHLQSEETLLAQYNSCWRNWRFQLNWIVLTFVLFFFLARYRILWWAAPAAYGSPEATHYSETQELLQFQHSINTRRLVWCRPGVGNQMCWFVPVSCPYCSYRNCKGKSDYKLEFHLVWISDWYLFWSVFI